MAPIWEVPDADVGRRLLSEPLPLGLRPRALARAFHRDVYFDTPSGELRQRGLACRIRYALDDRRWLSLEATDGTPIAADVPVPDLDPPAILGGRSAPARKLRALIEPGRLVPGLELETTRQARTFVWPGVPLAVVRLTCDGIVARAGELTVQFHELDVRALPWARPLAARAARRLARRHGLRPAEGGRVERAEALLGVAESGRLARAMQGAGEVVVIGVAHGRLGLRRSGAALELPCMPGSGEEGARALMRQVLGTSEGELRLVGSAPAAYPRPALEVWLARRLPRSLEGGGAGIQWFAPTEVVTLVGSPVLRSPRTLAALTVAARSDLVPEWSRIAFVTRAEPSLDDEAAARVTLSELRVPTLPAAALDADRPAPEQFINAELSWLEFNARVLALAERAETPLRARLRFLAIFSTNLDQFFMVDVGGLKYAVAAGRTRPSIDGLAPQETLDAIAIRLRPLLDRQAACFAALRAGPLADHGVRLLTWAALAADEQAALRGRFAGEIQPLLTPKALTRAPGHPFPFIADRRLSLALVLRDRPGSPVHYAHLELPDRLPRFVPSGDGLRLVPLEDVVRANLDLVYPGRTVVEAHLFRITRSGDIQLDDAAASSFVHAVEEEVRRRPFGPVVRIEVERSMPAALRDLLQREFRFEESDQRSALTGTDVYEAPDLVDLGAVHQLAVLPLAGSEYPPFQPAEPFDPARPVLDQLDQGDVLVHHPYDSFAATFERFVEEAADDPDVTGIKLTLYRPGDRSAIGDALRRAAASGKDVSVCIELKARFDETLNIQWARSLERDGIHVVTGLVALKTHAKLALVVRHRDGRVRRYAHVGTGNYNRETAAVYSDLGLFTGDDAVAGEVHALFNELTGSSQPPEGRFRRLLVAPNYLLRGFLDLIEREGEHARAGRPARVRAKLNGLADAAVIGALYRASQAGAEVDLVVRGICMLRPGVPGLSERIRVVSVLGRFLEHARVYYFANGGAPEYYIGSADWRPRNLRRRVEVVVPVTDARARQRLDLILETELADPTAWELGADGGYARREPGPGEDGRGAQQRLLDVSSPSGGAVV